MTTNLTDESIMSFGKHQGKALKDVPASYLMWLYDEPASVGNADLRRYIEENKEVLLKEINESKVNYHNQISKNGKNKNFGKGNRR